jgi:hypothetical protein
MSEEKALDSVHVANEETFVAKEDKSVAREEKSVAKERKSVAKEGKLGTKEDEVVANDNDGHLGNAEEKVFRRFDRFGCSIFMKAY